MALSSHEAQGSFGSAREGPTLLRQGLKISSSLLLYLVLSLQQ